MVLMHEFVWMAIGKELAVFHSKVLSFSLPDASKSLILMQTLQQVHKIQAHDDRIHEIVPVLQTNQVDHSN